MDELTLNILDRVMARMESKLASFDIGVSFDHRAALNKIAGLFAYDVTHPESADKWAISLATGLGKTQLLVALLNTLKEMDIIYPVLVCVPNLKAMEELIDDLLECHTLEDVGCKHSDNNHEQIRHHSANNNELNKYRILVITHSRTNLSRSDWELCLRYKDLDRTVYYDEALKRGAIAAGRKFVLDNQIHNIRRQISEDARSYLNNIVDNMNEGSIIPLACDDTIRYNILNGITNYKRYDKGTSFTLLEGVISGNYDYLRIDKEDCFSFYNTLPEMRSLFVLDANHNYSLLAEYDDIQNLDIAPFKRYDNVVFKASSNKNGKVAILSNKQYYLEWAKVKYEKAKADGLSPVVICFKDMLEDVKASIDPNPIQWGRHAGSNLFRDKDAIICIGINRIKNEDAKGLIALHSNDLDVSVDNHNEVAEGEALLDLYQAVSRGKSRKVMVVDGKTVAQPSIIFLPGKLTTVQYNLLQEVMPGCKYQDDKFDAVITDILALLDGKDGNFVSSAMLGKHVPAYQALSRQDRNHVLEQMRNYGWHRSGRSLRKGHGLNLTQIAL